jgi:hypothetical protein
VGSNHVRRKNQEPEIMTKIDELMALVERATFFNPKSESLKLALQDVRAALEAALKPGEPVYAFRKKGLDDFCTCDARRYLEFKNKPHAFEVTIFYTAAPPAQTPAYINQAEAESHGYLSQPVTIRNPAQTPPPRLTDYDVNKIWLEFGSVTFDQIRTIETLVRKQAGWE